jgi:hypothetical protein
MGSEMKEEKSESEKFYGDCVDILKCGFEYVEPPKRRNRWNNRAPGNGRFPGLGVIRMFSADNIHVMWHNPTVCSTFKSKEEVLSFLQSLKQ